jgi:predicted transposase YdaD
MVEESTDGIYTIKGDILPMQIIDSRKLPAAENLWLKSLRDQLNSAEITQISEEMSRQEKNAQIAAYLNVITEANTESIQEAMEMGQRKQKLTVDQLCENVGWAAKWEARGEARGKAEGKAEGMKKGLDEGKLEIARKMKQADRPFSEIAEFTGLSPRAIQNL